MDKVKQAVALTVAGILVLGAAGWFLLISPKRSDAAAIREQAASQVMANSALQTQIATLKAQAKNLPKQQANLAAVAAKIPDNPSLPALIRSLTTAADKAGVELVSLSPGQPVAAGATGASVAPSAATPAAPVVAGSAGALQQIPVVMNVVGGYFQVEQYMDALENLTRAFKVSGLTLAPGANPVKPSSSTVVDTKSLATTITGNVYMASGRPTASVAAVGK